MYLAGVECALDASHDRVGELLARNDLNALELRRQYDNVETGAVCLDDDDDDEDKRKNQETIAYLEQTTRLASKKVNGHLL